MDQKLYVFLFTDINECTANGGIGDCENGANCTNTDGSFTCSCAIGWTGALCADGIEIILCKRSILVELSYYYFMQWAFLTSFFCLS